MIIEDTMLQNSKCPHLNITGPSSQFVPKYSNTNRTIDNITRQSSKPSTTTALRQREKKTKTPHNNPKTRGFYYIPCLKHFEGSVLRHFRRKHEGICKKIGKITKTRLTLENLIVPDDNADLMKRIQNQSKKCTVCNAELISNENVIYDSTFTIGTPRN